MKLRQIVKLAVGNLLFAVVAVILYSPGLIGLKFGVTAVKSALCVSVGITGVIGWIGFNLYNLSGKNVKVLESHETSLSELRGSFQELPGKKSLSGNISASVKQIDKWEEARSTYLRQVKIKFGHTSLTSVKYSGVLDRIEEVLRRNLAVVYNKCAVFKESEYQLLISVEYQNDEIDDGIQEQRLELYNQSIEDIRGLLAENEKLLYKLDSLMFRMADLQDRDNSAAEEEIEKLVDDLQYYDSLGGE